MRLSTQGKLRLAAKFAFLAGVSAMATSTHAQEADASSVPDNAPAEGVQLDKIQVTGSRIRAVDNATSEPIFTINRADITATGATTIGELLQSLPAASGVVTNPQVNNGGGNGGASVNLRGIGAERTLVLIDGRRTVGTTFSDIDYTDLDTFPINMIERIEILKEGASAIYGSDAIGGVVNIITRKQFTGAELEGTYGKTTEGDGRHRDLNATWGAGSATSHAVFGLEYQDQGSINAKDRELTSKPTAFYYAHLSPNVGTSGRVPMGRWTLPAAVFTGADGTSCGKAPTTNPDTGVVTPGRHPSVTRIPGTTGSVSSDYRCFTNNADVGPTDRYNFLPDNLLLTPAKRYEAFFEGESDVTSNIQFFGSGFFNHTQSNSQLAAEPFDNGTTAAVIGPTVISAANIYNPFGADISTFALRPQLVGDRIGTVNTATYQGTLGFRGTLLDKYQWETAYSIGRIDQHESDYGFLNFSNLKNQLGPSFYGDAAGAAVPAGTTGAIAYCGSPGNIIPQCSPINPFGTDGNTIAALGTTANEVVKQTQQVADAGINGDLLELPAGPLSAALGFEYRKYTFDRTTDGLEQAFLLSENNSKPTAGSFDVREYYAEFRIPLLSDLPFLKSLVLTPGVRFSDYSSFGHTTNAKYGLEYRPINDLLLRGTYADVFRAPTINDLFKGSLQDSPGLVDPCNGLMDAIGVNANHDAECGPNVARDGNFHSLNTQASAVRTGNPDLKPETGYTTDFGLVYSPEWYRPLSIEVDLWHYKIDHTIGLLDTTTAANACFNTGQLCQYSGAAARDGDGQLNNSIEPSLNTGSLDTRGIDFGFKLRYPHTFLGSFVLSEDTTYLDTFKTKTIIAGQTLDSYDSAGKTDGGVGGSFPRIKAFTTVSWSLNAFSVSLRDRFLGSFDDGTNYSAAPYDNLESSIDAAEAGQCDGVSSKTTPSVPGDPTSAPIRCHHQAGIANYVDLSATYTYVPASTSFTVGVTDLFNEGGQFLATAAAGGVGTGYPTDPSLYDLTGRAFFARIRAEFK